MVRRRVAEAVQSMSAQLLVGDGSRYWRGAQLDSRRIEGGELFFALPGEQTDGRRFALSALERGAAAAVVAQPDPAFVEAVETLGTSCDVADDKPALIAVDDALDGLHELTRAVRKQVPERLVGLTGSAGKTTTKELLVLMLARRYRTVGSPGNLNNLYGFPIALLGIPDDTEWMVAEMGMSTPGELGGVSRLGRPDVALFTNVRAVHLEAFETTGRSASIDDIREAKAELLEGTTTASLVVANAADPAVVDIARRHLERGGQVVGFAMDRHAALESCGFPVDLWVEDYEALDIEGIGSGGRFRLLSSDGDDQEIVLPMHGRINAENCLAAATCARRLGVSLAEIAQAASNARLPSGRGRVVELAGGVKLIDDSYNSNPAALSLALEAAAAVEGDRHWCVLGEMRELGANALTWHEEAGVQAARLGLDPVVGVGELAHSLVLAAAAEGARTAWFVSADQAAAWVAGELRSGDVLLVKGSRGVALERLVARLTEEVV